MRCFGIQWPPGWEAEYSFNEDMYRRYVKFRGEDGRTRFSIRRHKKQAIYNEGYPGAYDARAVWHPLLPGVGRIGYYDTPNEALAACLFYTGKE